MSDKDQDETGLGTEEYSMEKLDQMVIERQRESFNRLPIRQAVSELEELPVEEIRGALTTLGILEDPIRLRETAEASLKLVGDDEHSGIIAALEPEEIGQIACLSPEIFNQELCDLLKPEDFGQPDKWLLITLEEKKAIESAGNRFLIQLLFNLKEQDWACQKDKGPWAILKEQMVISSQTILGYVSAICHAQKRDCEWKCQALECLGIYLIAYAAKSLPEILTLCREIDDALVDRLRIIMADPDLKVKALEQFALELPEFQPPKEPVKSKKSLLQLVDGLRAVGIEDPTPEEIEVFQEAGETIEQALKTGLPENGDKS